MNQFLERHKLPNFTHQKVFKFIDIKLFLMFSYNPFNFYKVTSDVLSCIPDFGNLCVFFVFFLVCLG